MYGRGKSISAERDHLAGNEPLTKQTILYTLLRLNGDAIMKWDYYYFFSQGFQPRRALESPCLQGSQRVGAKCPDVERATAERRGWYRYLG